MIISGAIYYGLPQNEYALDYLSIFGFANPKSAILICPSNVMRIFSGFISR
jgi:hypothetical protein